MADLINCAIVSSPIQYFLSRVVASRFPSEGLRIVVPLDHGDNRAIFADIDQMLGWSPVELIPFTAGTRLALGPIDRLFSSNRFNPLEIEIILQLRRHARRLCAYEDGLAIYARRSPFDSRLDDTRRRRVFKMLCQMKLYELGWRREAPIFLPFLVYDEVYSIFDEVPGMRPGARWFSVAESCRALLGQRPAGSASECVFLSQSLTRDRFVAREDYVNFVVDVLERLRSAYSVVYYKAHPRDEPEVTASILARVPCASLEGSYGRVPVEIFSASRPEVDLYGFGTSALSYVKALYGANAFTVNQLFDERCGVGERLRAMWNISEPILAKAGVVRLHSLDEIAPAVGDVA